MTVWHNITYKFRTKGALCSNVVGNRVILLRSQFLQHGDNEQYEQYEHEAKVAIQL